MFLARILISSFCSSRTFSRYLWLRSKLAWANREGPVGEWLSMLPESERPAAKEVRMMASLLDDFGVQKLELHEGRWLLERITKDDWKTWANTAEEAILGYFGIERATQGLSDDRMDYLRRAFPHYFQ